MTFVNFGGLQKANWMRSSHFLRVLRAAAELTGLLETLLQWLLRALRETSLSLRAGNKRGGLSKQCISARLNAWVEALSRVPGLDPQVSAVASHEGNRRRARCLSISTNKDIGGPED